MSKLNNLLYCPICGPPQCGFKQLHSDKSELSWEERISGNSYEYWNCLKCGWIGKGDEMCGPYDGLPDGTLSTEREQWLNEQRSKKLKEILNR